MEEIKSKIATQFKIFERSGKDSTKIHPRNKHSEVQNYLSYMEQQLKTIEVKNYEVQEMVIDNNVEY